MENGRCRHTVCEEARSSVAKEIFDLIEDECLAYPMKDDDLTILVDKRNYEEIKKKYTEDK